MRLIIAGGRDFNNYSLLKETVNKFLTDYNDEPCIICGKAKGADTLGERFAKSKVIKSSIFLLIGIRMVNLLDSFAI